MIICPNCKKELADGVRFCDGCGFAMPAQPAPQPAPQPEGAKTPDVVATVKEKLTAIPKKFLLIGAVAVAALALIIILASLIFGGSKEPKYALYIRDGEIQYSTLSGKAKEVTSDLYDGATNQQLSQVGSASYFFTVSEDGKKLFYIDKVDGGAQLYVRSLTNFKKEPVKIDSDIQSYVVNEKANLVTYIKSGDEDVLYQHNLKDKEKIASAVENFFVTKDGKKIVYLTDDGDLYVKQKGKDKVKLDSLVDELCGVDKSLSKLYYIKEGTLYYKNGNKDKVKIASDVDDVINVYESGEIYYTVKELVQAENVAGGASTDTVAPAPSESKGFDAQSEFDKYVENMGADLVELFYYNGKKSTKIADISDVEDYATDRAVLAYAYFDLDSVNVDKLTEENFYEKMQNLFKEPEYRVAIKEKIHEIQGAEDVYNVSISADGKALYYLSDVSEKNEGDLFEAKLSGKVGAPKAIDTEVYYSGINRLESGAYIYYKDVNTEKSQADLYINKKAVDTDVKLYSCRYSKELNKVVYYVDYNSEKQQGTLKSATLKGKSTPISDDVHSFVFTPEGKILYLYDYSLTSYKGDLYISSGKKGKKLDEDVVAVLAYASYTDMMNAYLGYED